MLAFVPLRRILSRGKGVVAALTGPPGIGKSHAARAALDALPARSFMVDAAAPARAILASLPAARREPAWLAAVQDRAEHLSARELASATVARLKAHAPAVLVVDHFHRADAERRDAWSHVAALVREARGVALIVLSRDALPSAWTPTRLEALDRAASDALLNDRVERTLPNAACAWLFRHARGHPLFTLELLAHVRRSGHLTSHDGAWRWRSPKDVTVPSTVEATVRALLPADLGDADWTRLARVLVLDELAPAVADDRLERAGLLTHGRLAHPLYREALLPTLPTRHLRAVLSAAPVDTLADPRRVAKLLPDGAVEPDVFAALLEAAARQARGEEAATLWERAASVGRADERAVRLWRAAEAVGQHAPSVALTFALRALACDPPLDAENADAARRHGAAMHAFAGGAAETLPAALLETRDRDALLRHFECQRVLAARAANDFALAVRLFEALPDPNGAPLGVKQAYGLCLFYLRRFDDATAALEDVAARTDDPNLRALALNNLALVPMYQGRYDAALDLLDRVDEAASHVPQDARRAYLQRLAMSNRSLVYGRLGRTREALELAEAALQHDRDRGTLAAYASQLVHVARLYVEFGRFEEAQSLLFEARTLESYLAPPYRSNVLLGLLKLYTDWPHEHSVALRLHHAHELQRACEDAPGPHDREWTAISLALTKSGQPEDGRAFAQRVLDDLDARGEAQGTAVTTALYARARAAAELGDVCAAVADLTRAEVVARPDGDVQADFYAMWAAHFAGNVERRDELVAHFTRLGFSPQGFQFGAAPAPVSAAPVARARVHALGAVRVFTPDGRTVKSDAARTLLAMLLCARVAGEPDVNAEDAARFLYPDRSPEAAETALRGLTSRLRRTLGANAVVASGGRLALGDVTSDAEDFLSDGDAERWQGPFLADQVLAEHAEAARAVLLARLEASAEVLLPSEPREAARLATLLCRSEPYEWRHVRTLLRAHDAAGDPRAAAHAYRLARARFAEVGDDSPDDWRTFLTRAAREERAERGGVVLPVLVSVAVRQGARAARTLGVERSTVQRWRSGETKYPGRPGRPSKLDADSLADVLKNLPASPASAGFTEARWTLALVSRHIERATGVQLSRAQVSRLMRRHGASLDAPTPVA